MTNGTEPIEYHVEWAIDLDATSPEQAAQIAYEQIVLVVVEDPQPKWLWKVTKAGSDDPPMYVTYPS